MKAIITTYHGPTNHRPSCIVAKDSDGNTAKVTLSYEGDSAHDYQRAAEALVRKMGWTGEMVGGGTKDGYVWVFTDKASPRFTVSA
jgi:hypothetical protein